MKRVQFIALTGAVVFHAGVLLFGGLLFTKHAHQAAKTDEEVAVTEEQQAPPPPEKETPEPAKNDAEPPPPELAETPPMDLAQLDLAMSAGAGDGGGGDFGVRLAAPGGRGEKAAGGESSAQAAEAVFSLADLDQAPRAVFQPPPDYPAELKKKMAGTVSVMFIVDPSGRVTSPLVQRSTHPAFEPYALAAVRKWKFEPGKRNGRAVAFKLKVPISFRAG